MSVFRFKRFEVRNELSAMKVNTDGVILGAATPVSGNESRVLDIGTGTGTIALMLAQRISDRSAINLSKNSCDDEPKNLKIIGIDIDYDAAVEASANFLNSPWNNFLEAKHLPLSGLKDDSIEQYDIIISNPPYYDSSLTNPDVRKTIARHTDGLSYREILDFAENHLSPRGIVSLILPADQEMQLLRYGRMRGLKCDRLLRIRTTARKNPSRIVTVFSLASSQASTNGKTSTIEEELTIMEKGKYTFQYISLIKDFYTFA